jgi:ABC-type transport system involved in cytochrome c biogenesis permease subunit
MLPELVSVGIALACFGWLLFWSIAASRPLSGTMPIMSLGLASAALGTGITLRWQRTGQGPFLTLFEVLLSNLFSISFVLLVLFLGAPRTRPAAPFAAIFLALLAAWALVSNPETVALPPTFDHPWLWAHVVSGKLFLAFCVAGVSLAAAVWSSRGSLAAESYEPRIWGLMSAAFVFESFMLLAGAVWAHDAWGRYWSWDPLETWSLLTWLSLAILLHLRLTVRLPPVVGWSMAFGVLVIAFLTFFGVPFVSVAPHKGAM